MRQIVGIGGVVALLVLGGWRALAALLERRRDLAASGELQRRLAARRTAAITRALVRAGLAEPELARVRVPVDGARLHASVHVGSIRGAEDIDDVGLLEGAMRRAAAERMDVGAAGIARRPGARPAVRPDRAPAGVADAAGRRPRAVAAPVVPSPPGAERQLQPRTDWRRLLDDSRPYDGDRDLGASIPAWAVPAAIVGFLLTLVPLVRPLADQAPLLALAGVALIVAAVLGARGRRR